MEQRTRRRGSSGSFADARRGLFRATLLFGSIAGALMLITVPDADHRSRQVAENGDVDGIVTGSIGQKAPSGAKAGPWSVDRMTAGPCIMFPDGTQRGACR